MKSLRLWGPFVCASLLTFLAYKTFWAAERYYLFLSLLGILSCFFAVMVLKRTGRTWSAVAGVTIGLLIGQWWFVENLILRAFWRFGGFAP
jgi:hypothetical protein